MWVQHQTDDGASLSIPKISGDMFKMLSFVEMNLYLGFVGRGLD